MMEEEFKISTGILECYSNYVIFHFNARFYEQKQAKEFINAVDAHYKGRKCVVLANRQMAEKVNPEIYKDVRSKSIVGIAIVSDNEAVKAEAYNEQELFKGSFSYFKTIDEASNWANTVVAGF